MNIIPVSGYRSYSQQASLYDSYVRQYGQATADTLAARPGFSEHQTGLAMDIGNASGVCALQACFATTPAGKWAAANAATYGFIIRYPAGAEAVTGYTYEPWHLRYVGRDLARAGQHHPGGLLRSGSGPRLPLGRHAAGTVFPPAAAGFRGNGHRRCNFRGQ